MTGAWLRRYTPRYAPGPLHRCEPPVRGDRGWELPDGDHGFLWRCECGRLWEVTEYPFRWDPTYRALPQWRKAGLLTRIQYRRRRGR